MCENNIYFIHIFHHIQPAFESHLSICNNLHCFSVNNILSNSSEILKL